MDGGLGLGHLRRVVSWKTSDNMYYVNRRSTPPQLADDVLRHLAWITE
jgi:hypothetical protein